MSVTDAPRVTVPPFVPHRWLENGHVMTIYAWARARQFPSLPAPEARLIRVSPDTQVLTHCYWQAERSRRPTLIALHGLEGSSEAHYMRTCSIVPFSFSRTIESAVDTTAVIIEM